MLKRKKSLFQEYIKEDFLHFWYHSEHIPELEEGRKMVGSATAIICEDIQFEFTTRWNTAYQTVLWKKVSAFFQRGINKKKNVKIFRNGRINVLYFAFAYGIIAAVKPNSFLSNLKVALTNLQEIKLQEVDRSAVLHGICSSYSEAIEAQEKTLTSEGLQRSDRNVSE